jgi:hypothetical protein
MYYQTLRNCITGFTNVQPTSLRIETLFNQIKDAVDITNAANAAYTAPQIVAYTYNLVFKLDSLPMPATFALAH